MEKRVIFAFILSFAVLYAFRALYSPPAPTETPAVVQTPTPVPPTKSLVPPNPPAEKSEVLAASTKELRAEKAEEFEVDTPLYTATLRNFAAGGGRKELKEHPIVYQLAWRLRRPISSRKPTNRSRKEKCCLPDRQCVQACEPS